VTLRRVLVKMSVTEQRYRAVLEVHAGATVTDVADRFGVSRQAVHRWLGWYADHGLEGLADRSSRPHSSPGQTPPEVEAAICELRRNHPASTTACCTYSTPTAPCCAACPTHSAPPSSPGCATPAPPDRHRPHQPDRRASIGGSTAAAP
jgi:transposase-like protein